MKKRKLNRLQNHDYSQQGMYFVTICTKGREELFGRAKKGKMVLNEVGEIASRELQKIPNYFENIFLDECVIMPNHVHLIIEIIDKNVGADLVSARNKKGQTQGLSLHNSRIGLVSKIMQSYKSRTTVECIKLMKSENRSCVTKIWQRSFYDRIIRNEAELNKIREYIFKNPINWERDRNNLENIFM